MSSLTHRKMKVALLMGGSSSEREISLMSGAEVEAALRRLGHDVITVDPAVDGVAVLAQSRPDAAFLALHGQYGEDGCIQGTLEMLGIPYTGSRVLASAVAMDKTVSKVLFGAAEVSTPPSVTVDRSAAPELALARAQSIGFPCVVKPSSQGSTVGITIVKESAALADALELAFRSDPDALIEKYIAGTEVTVGVLGTRDPRALPTLEIVPTNEFYDWDSKYTPGKSEHVVPARIPETARAECERLAVKAHVALKCRGYSRVDMIVEPSGQVWVLEVNTLPGLTKVSLLPDAARAEGISFDQLIQTILNSAFDE
ncbi:MAG: D-alanine--D-alanine ligase [Bacillota bacterium]